MKYTTATMFLKKGEIRRKMVLSCGLVQALQKKQKLERAGFTVTSLHIKQRYKDDVIWVFAGE